jgi:uncharacterized RDD family membrane protein YckC
MTPVAYAHWIKRAAGFALDFGLLGLAPYWTIVLFANHYDLRWFEIIATLVLTAFYIWNVIVLQGNTGQSLGKRWIGIRLVHEEGEQPIGPLMAFIRAAIHIIDQLPAFLGFLWPLWDAKRQTFTDKVMRTIVIENLARP